MSFLRVEYFSMSLFRTTEYGAFIPDDTNPEEIKDNIHYKRQMKTLVLLHGYGGRYNDWITGCSIAEMSRKYNLAILLPCGDNSFYIDREETGAAYGTFVSCELLRHARKLFHLSEKREDTFIGGYSMGGFGAIRNGLMQSDTYSKIIGLSNALVMYMLPELNATNGNELANLQFYDRIFGKPEEAEKSDRHPEHLIKEHLREDRDLPQMYFTCGTEDFLINENRRWHKFLDDNKVAHVYLEDAGIHDWEFWNKSIEPAIKWLTAED